MAKNMRIHQLVFLAILIGQQQIASTMSVNEIFNVMNYAKNETAANHKLEEVVNGLKDFMKKGWEPLQLPVLDPLCTSPQNLSIDTSYLRGHFDVSTINITGLSDYNVLNATFQLQDLVIQVSVEWPKIEGSFLNYSINDGRVMKFFKLHGNGNATFVVKNVQFSIKTLISVNENNSSLSIKDLQTSLSIGKNGEKDSITFHCDGLKQNKIFTTLLTRVISRNALPLFNANADLITNSLNNIITLTVNNYLSTESLNGLVNRFSK